MYVTGKQAATIAELSDGADVSIYGIGARSSHRRKGTVDPSTPIRFIRMEDGLMGTITAEGDFIPRQAKIVDHSVKA